MPPLVQKKTSYAPIIPLASNSSFPYAHTPARAWGSHLNTAASVGVFLQRERGRIGLGDREGGKQGNLGSWLQSQHRRGLSPAPARQLQPRGSLCHHFIKLGLSSVLCWDPAQAGEGGSACPRACVTGTKRAKETNRSRDLSLGESNIPTKRSVSPVRRKGMSAPHFHSQLFTGMVVLVGRQLSGKNRRDFALIS